MDGVEEVTGDLTIANSVYLTDLDGLDSLATVGGMVDINGNDSPTDLDGIASLTSVSEDLYIYDNGILCQSYIDALIASISVGGSTYTARNDTGC